MTERERKFLNVGSYHFARTPTEIHTFLGSCVSVCLFDPVHRYGAMNHILLPGIGGPLSDTKSARFGVNAMELLLREFARLGIASRSLMAKVFGGAVGLNGLNDLFKVAENNVAFVYEFLKIEGIPVIVSDTGGHHVRAIHLYSDTFEVFVKKTSLAAKYVERKESSFSKTIAETVEKAENRYILF